MLRYTYIDCLLNPLNAELNAICHLLALLGAHHILHLSWIKVNLYDLYSLLLICGSFIIALGI